MNYVVFLLYHIALCLSQWQEAKHTAQCICTIALGRHRYCHMYDQERGASWMCSDCMIHSSLVEYFSFWIIRITRHSCHSVSRSQKASIHNPPTWHTSTAHRSLFRLFKSLLISFHTVVLLLCFIERKHQCSINSPKLVTAPITGRGEKNLNDPITKPVSRLIFQDKQTWLLRKGSRLQIFFPSNQINTEVWRWGIYLLLSAFDLCKGYEDICGSSQLNSTTEPNLNVIVDLSRMPIFTWFIFSSWDCTASGRSSVERLALWLFLRCWQTNKDLMFLVLHNASD